MADITEVFLSNFKEYRNYTENSYIHMGIIRNGNKSIHISMEGLDERDAYKWKMQLDARVKVMKDKIYILPVQISGKRKARGPWYSIHPARMKEYISQGFKTYLCRFLNDPISIFVFDVSINKKQK